MNLKAYGSNTLTNEVTGITKDGLWIYVNEKEYYIPFKEYPMLKNKPVDQIFDLKYSPPNHLYWEGLDIDIELEALRNPEKYPLEFK